MEQICAYLFQSQKTEISVNIFHYAFGPAFLLQTGGDEDKMTDDYVTGNLCALLVPPRAEVDISSRWSQLRTANF